MYKVLACGEFSELSSGYAVYMKQLLSKLVLLPNIEVVELACFVEPGDPRLSKVKWPIIPVIPPKSDVESTNHYNSNHFNKFGYSVFNEALLQVKPTHVLDFRDCWNFEFEFRSPLRDFYSHIIMPAIDAFPQHKSWLDMYSTADKVLSYTDWGIDILKQAGLKNIGGCAAPCGGDAFRPLPKEEIMAVKNSIGLGDIKIVGTVMRNQRRKLFPNLFSDFKEFLIRTGRKDTYLFCHTSYPDTWELNKYLIDYEVADKVLFSYSCPDCNSIMISFFKGPHTFCRKCSSPRCRFTSTGLGISSENMNHLYNIMDVYVQYATCEGFGIPMVEAVQAGIPVMAVNYSAMEENIRKSLNTPIDVSHFVIEAETGRNFAYPNRDDFVNKLQNMLEKPKETLQANANLSSILFCSRGYDDVARVWYDDIVSTKPKLSWDSPRRYNQNIQYPPEGLSTNDYARYLIREVLQDESKIGSYFEARLVRDLENGFALRGFDNKYYFEDIIGLGQQALPFDRQIAFSHFVSLLEEKVGWENRRRG